MAGLPAPPHVTLGDSPSSPTAGTIRRRQNAAIGRSMISEVEELANNERAAWSIAHLEEPPPACYPERERDIRKAKMTSRDQANSSIIPTLDAYDGCGPSGPDSPLVLSNYLPTPRSSRLTRLNLVFPEPEPRAEETPAPPYAESPSNPSSLLSFPADISNASGMVFSSRSPEEPSSAVSSPEVLSPGFSDFTIIDDEDGLLFSPDSGILSPVGVRTGEF
ncbi:hypothetical protein BN946_scf184794.g14 [Trametes cinnabarina]|uniref:Uncharacterized protein n=1 Tax=Pycnoporus cinnabarinus TaxID=5643 RepID=A0A060SL04_PYCCI|nr:hypothetical protein BN946_scf184794.g14 [Trametes cinnabarina]